MVQLKRLWLSVQLRSQLRSWKNILGYRSAGQAKADTTIALIDEAGKPVEQGQSGEILIAGPSVSKGYLNNPEKTAHAFVEFEGRPAYKTGDLGQYDEAGQLLYKGRIDFQIKLHGFRIELEDVDHHLDKVSYVAQATTVPRYGKRS